MKRRAGEAPRRLEVLGGGEAEGGQLPATMAEVERERRESSRAPTPREASAHAAPVSSNARTRRVLPETLADAWMRTRRAPGVR